MAWSVSGHDLWICFNRDEQRSRPEAELPLIRRDGRYPVVFARDPQGGGTWLAVSKAGFVVALMNNYEASHGNPSMAQSRGGIVTRLIQSESAIHAQKDLSEGIPLKNYAPFFIFILSFDKGKQWSWDGNCLAERLDCPMFWTTSSYKSESVTLWRTREWKNLIGNRSLRPRRAAEILRMRSPDPAFGMTMDREDARTVSQTLISMDQKSLRLEYTRREMGGLSYQKPVVCSW